MAERKPRTQTRARLVDPIEDRGHRLDAAYQVWDKAVAAAWSGYRAASKEAWSGAMAQVQVATDDYQRQVDGIRDAT